MSINFTVTSSCCEPTIPPYHHTHTTIPPYTNLVCQKHTMDKFYYCRSCGYHDNVTTPSFPLNTSIIEANLAEYKQAEKACDAFREAINELERLKNDPKQHIETVIGELKAQVYLTRDDLIKEIELKSEQIIADLNNYQLECTCSLSRLEKIMTKVEIILGKEKLRLENLLAKFRSWYVMFGDGEIKWKPITERGEIEKKKVVAAIEKVKKLLLPIRNNELNEKINNFCQLKILNAPKRLEY